MSRVLIGYFPFHLRIILEREVEISLLDFSRGDAAHSGRASSPSQLRWLRERNSRAVEMIWGAVVRRADGEPIFLSRSGVFFLCRNMTTIPWIAARRRFL